MFIREMVLRMGNACQKSMPKAEFQHYVTGSIYIALGLTAALLVRGKSDWSVLYFSSILIDT